MKIDLAQSQGTPVYPAAPGKVAKIIDHYWCGGNMVYINHYVNGKYYTTAYMHLLEYYVYVGQEVNNNTNDIIKKVANTYEINEKNYDNEVIINENEKDIYFDYMNLKFIDVDINKLKTFNPDTIGFIKVMGTNIKSIFQLVFLKLAPTYITNILFYY